MDMGRTAEALRRNGFFVSVFETKEEASGYLEREISGMSVGFGDSATLLNMGLFERLRAGGSGLVADPQHPEEGKSFAETGAECLTTEVFLTSVNALSQTGELVNIDGMGNRAAGSLFGHRKVYFVAGVNKITDSLEKAVWRARNIAAPKNARRLGLKTPCAVRGGGCYNCASPQRICNGLVIYLKKMEDMDMEVVLIREELGL